MAFGARVLCDSISPHDVRLTTFEVVMPRIILAEMNTHRVFTRNSASSRAIPVEKRISIVESDPFVPESFGRNCSGMQAHEELTDKDAELARSVWDMARRKAIHFARDLAAVGVHKQLANRLIEPWVWQTALITSTEWENFYALRRSAEAQPEIRRVADLMYEAHDRSEPTRIGDGEWHLPLLPDRDWLINAGFSMNDLCRISIGRCARVAHVTHTGERDPAADIALFERLLNNGHMSPFEHVARPITYDDALGIVSRFVDFGTACPTFRLDRTFNGNIRGWTQYRKTIPNEHNFAARKQAQ